MQPTPTTKKAMAAIRYFEEQGKEICGVAIKGSEFKLDFKSDVSERSTAADLVDMSQ